LCWFALPPAYADDDSDQFVAGTYEVIGRRSDSTQLYSGTVQITEVGHDLRLERHIGGHTDEGSARFETTSGDDTLLLVMSYHEQGVEMSAYCTVGADLDNYARITCLTGGTRTKKPGIEALFIEAGNANTPAPSHARYKRRVPARLRAQSARLERHPVSAPRAAARPLPAGSRRAP
jgi:hypothetical protein